MRPAEPRLSTSPARLGLAISGVLVTALLVSEYALGRLQILLGPSGDIRDLRIAVVHCLLVGYLPAAYLYVVRGARVTILALQPALECGPAEFDQLAQSAGRFGRRGLLIAGLIGLLVSLSGPYVAPPVGPAPWDPRTWSPEVAWHRVLGPVLGWFFAWFAYALLKESGRLSRLAGRLAPIDLFDLRPLAPFTGRGLANALLAVGAVSVFSLFLLEQGFGLLFAILGASTLVVAVWALVQRVRGVHRRIKSAKEAQLDWSRERIRRARAALKGSAEAERGELADLVAYQALVERVQEWPFDTSTYVRFALYLLLPLGSWAAGGLIEGLVQALLF